MRSGPAWSAAATASARSPASPIDDLPVTLAGEVEGFEPSEFMDTKEARRTDRFTQFGLASAQLAWQDAGSPEVVAERGGVIFATGIGGIETLLTQHSVLLEKGPGRVSPFMVPMLMANAPAGHIAMRYGFTGPTSPRSRPARPATTPCSRRCA